MIINIKVNKNNNPQTEGWVRTWSYLNTASKMSSVQQNIMTRAKKMKA